MVVASFCFFLLMFVAIGALSVLQRKTTSKDYLLAGRDVAPWLVALSAVATNNSGYMFIGQIGFTYMYGLQSIWLMIGWIFGDFVMSLFVHQRLRRRSEKRKALSFAGALSRWHGTTFRKLQFIGGILTVLFLGTYAGAQLNAGSKALHVLFGWDYALGAVIGAGIVLIYCMAGGIRASIWTDAAQSFVMMAAMLAMVVVAVMEIGGVTSFIDQLYAVGPEYMNLFPSNGAIGDMALGPVIGPMLFVLGWVFAGVGVIGQPHIMVRFMTMDDADNMNRVRAYYYSWYIAFYIMAIMAAFAAKLLIPDTANFDAELALPTLAIELLPDVLVGLVLAGLFAATMSTADSQILSCTAAVTNDIAPNRLNGYMVNKIVTACVTVIALGIALSGNESVFALVLIAWSGLASAFAPLLIVYGLRQTVSEGLALCMMIGGFATMMLWRWLELNETVYEILPGILAGLAIFGVGRVLGYAGRQAESSGVTAR